MMALFETLVRKHDLCPKLLSQTSPIHQELDLGRLEAFAGQVMGDIGGSLALLLAYLGDQTGIYRALRDGGRCSCANLAQRAGVDQRYLQEWLSAQAAAGYVTFHAEDETFSLNPEQALVFAQEGHPACLQGFVQLMVAQFATHEQATETLRSGQGRDWGEHHSCCFCATDRFFDRDMQPIWYMPGYPPWTALSPS